MEKHCAVGHWAVSTSRFCSPKVENTVVYFPLGIPILSVLDKKNKTQQI